MNESFLEKSFATDDHAALLEAAGGRAFTFFEKKSGRGHITKSASEVISKADMQEHAPPDDQFGVHLITMGAEEDYGANRNGDSASRKSLRDHHPSFEKFGCVFREHKNRDPVTEGVGTVRLARYNPAMNRGELIAWVEKDKAPDMYKKASAGEELSWSMSMRLPHDECSCCKKKSRRTDDYCSHLRDHMLDFVPGFEKYAYARNEDDVKFFDISEVKRRADRIATYLRYAIPGEGLAKAASADQIITGAQWAEHQFGPSRVIPFNAWEDLTLEKMAEAEEFVRHADDNTLQALAGMAPQNLSADQIEALAVGDFRSVSGELAKKAMILPFPTFASLVTGKTIDELEKDADYSEAAVGKLPSLLSDMFRMGGCCGDNDIAESVSPDEVGCSFSPEKDSIDRLMNETGGNLSMDQGSTKDRAVSVTIVKKATIAQPRPNAELDPFYDGLVNAYGRYVVKAAHQVKELPNVSEHGLFRSIAASLTIRL